jgi:predicted dehydrogenase
MIQKGYVMTRINRRDFLKDSASTGVTAGLVAAAPRSVEAASEKLVVGLMGCGGRGSYLLGRFASRADITVKYVCDPDARRLGRATTVVGEAAAKSVQGIADFRRMLEDDDVDIVINATPDHWHGVATVMACQAGKHVYVEKPVSHNIWEGRQMVAAARKYERVVQAGMQNRSADYVRHAVELVQSGRLGIVHTVRVHQMVGNPSRIAQSLTAKEEPIRPVPERFDYDMYCGPAPMVPFRSTSWMKQQFDFAAGAIPDDAVHQLDVARWLIGKRYPRAVHHAGGVLVAKDDREAQDTQSITYEFDNMLMVLQGSTVTPSLSKTPNSIRDGDAFPHWLFSSTRVEVYGTEGMMLFGRQGGGWQIWGPDGNLVVQEYGRHQTDEHIDDFIRCIHSGELPNGDIEEGHFSAVLCHLGNISYRLGNRALQFDGDTETFPNDPEANKLLKRMYREPWIIPESV